MPDNRPHTYPHGVPCWVDLDHPDPLAACRFYEGLFGWAFTEALPAGSYLIASVGGHDVAAIGQSEHPSQWATYISVDDADASTSAVIAAGGTVVTEPRTPAPEGVPRPAQIRAARSFDCGRPGSDSGRSW